MSQMGNVGVAKKKRIAKLRILVEQVIQKPKTFRILSTELPVTVIPQIDDILLVYAALTNTKQQIFIDKV